MYYEKQILPLDNKGNFLLAVHFPRHKIGGECTRESKQAFFAFGNIDTISDLTDITSLCCLDRKSDMDEAKECRQISSAQKNSVVNEKRAWEYSYKAELAEKDAKFIPRTVLTSTNGRLVVGIECNNEAVQRVINIFDQTIDHELNARGWSKANIIAYPSALSADGKSIICKKNTKPSPIYSEQSIDKGIFKRKTLATYSQISPRTEFISGNGGWIAVDNDTLHVFSYGSSSSIREFKVPKKVFSWSVEAAIDSSIVAFSGDKGLISIVNTDTGETKKYFPHRGCRRDDFAQVKLSFDGQWMVSKILNKSDLAVSYTHEGKSWKVGDIEDQVIVEREEGDYKSESLIPAAFAFIGSRLIVSEDNSVREMLVKEPEYIEQTFISEQGKSGARKPLKVTPNATIDKFIKEAGLGRQENQVKDHYYPAVKIKSKKSNKSGWKMPDKKGAPALGTSRLGGWPDLPEDIAWPTWERRPMGFLAQINLAEVNDVQPDIRLPKEGLLLFFLGCSDDTYESDELNREAYMLDLMLGVSSEQKAGWKVIYAKPDMTLQRTVYKGDILPEVFQPCLLRIMKGGMPLPHETTAAYDCLDLNQDERDNFNEVLDLISEEYAENQLGGYSHLVQFTPPEFFCALASSGNDPYSHPEKNTDELKLLTEQASEWGLLLQLTSDENPGFLWGDGGHFYFYGNRKEMEVGNFDSTWVYFEN